MTTLSLIYDNKQLRTAFQRSPVILAKHYKRQFGRGILEIANLAKRLAPKAYSTLTNSITTSQPDPFTGEVVAGTDYARMVEEGTGPGGWPNEQTMLDWIKVHQIQPNDPKMDQKDLAYVLARDIAMHGTPAQPYMTPSFEQKRQRMVQLSAKALDDALAEMGR